MPSLAFYDEFLSITKQPDEPLPSLVARVEEGLQKIQSSHSETLTLADFEQELASMALIRALPEEFNNFRSSLLLHRATGKHIRTVTMVSHFCMSPARARLWSPGHPARGSGVVVCDEVNPACSQ